MRRRAFLKLALLLGALGMVKAADAFERLAMGEELTPEEVAKVREFIAIMDGIGWDLEQVIAAIKGAGLVFTPGRVYAGERNVILDKNGITLVEGAAGVNSVTWKLSADGAAIGSMYTFSGGADPNQVGNMTLAPQPQSGATSASAYWTLKAVGTDASAAYKTRTQMIGGGGTLELYLYSTAQAIVNHWSASLTDTTFNEAGNDVDFRVEGENITDVLKVDAGLDKAIIHSVKTDSGDPTGQEGMLYYNTTDNVIKMYADGAWRTLASW